MRFIVSGGWSYGNIGDEVIAASTIYLMKNYFSDMEIIYTSYRPELFVKAHNIQAERSVHSIIEKHNFEIDIEKIQGLLEDLESIDLKEYADSFDSDTVFVMAGGGYFSESWTSQFIARILEIEIAKRAGAKVVLLGQSMGPFYSNEAKKILKDSLEKCSFLCVRDLDTKRILELLDLNVKVDLAPDVAVIISDIIEKNDEMKVVNIMPAAYSSYTAADSKKKNRYVEKLKKRFSIGGVRYKSEMKKIVKRLSEEYTLKFVMSTNWTWDIKFVNYLTKKIDKKKYIICNCSDANELCKELSCGRVLISTKMHPVIISTSYRIPALAISYNYKVDNFMKMIGRSDYCCEIGKIDARRMVRQIKSFMNNKQFVDIGVQKNEVYSMMDNLIQAISN